MFKQTDPKYKSVMMGFGTGSIYQYGCYLVSFVNGLNQKGYSFTPESMNDMLKAHQAWVGPYKNYIDVLNLEKYFPTIFVKFGKIDPWNDVPPTIDFLKSNLVVVCRVDARAIGGTGTHYVLLTSIQDNIAVIHDPWTGNVEKITVRYKNYGNILGLNIFNVVPFVKPTTPPPLPIPTPVPPVESPVPAPSQPQTPPASPPVISTPPVILPSNPTPPSNTTPSFWTQLITWFKGLFKLG